MRWENRLRLTRASQQRWKFVWASQGIWDLPPPTHLASLCGRGARNKPRLPSGVCLQWLLGRDLWERVWGIWPPHSAGSVFSASTESILPCAPGSNGPGKRAAGPTDSSKRADMEPGQSPCLLWFLCVISSKPVVLMRNAILESENASTFWSKAFATKQHGKWRRSGQSQSGLLESTCSRRTVWCWKPRQQPAWWKDRAGKGQPLSRDVMEELAARSTSQVLDHRGGSGNMSHSRVQKTRGRVQSSLVTF